MVGYSWRRAEEIKLKGNGCASTFAPCAKAKIGNGSRAKGQTVKGPSRRTVHPNPRRQRHATPCTIAWNTYEASHEQIQSKTW